METIILHGSTINAVHYCFILSATIRVINWKNNFTNSCKFWCKYSSKILACCLFCVINYCMDWWLEMSPPVSKSRIYHHISFNFLQIYIWFHIAVTISWPWWTVTSLSLPTQSFKIGKLKLIHYKANIRHKCSLNLQIVRWFNLPYFSYLS